MKNGKKNIDCPFCNNEVSSRIIYKDDFVIAFSTNIPITPGHILVCPKRHVAKIDQLSDEELKAIKSSIIRLKNSIVKSLNAEGFNMAWNEGEIAGQTVGHLHFHIVPRKAGDEGVYKYEPRKFLYRPGSRSKSPEEELRKIAELIKKNL